MRAIWAIMGIFKGIIRQPRRNNTRVEAGVQNDGSYNIEVVRENYES
jgi:hypothetical protein